MGQWAHALLFFFFLLSFGSRLTGSDGKMLFFIRLVHEKEGLDGPLMVCGRCLSGRRCETMPLGYPPSPDPGGRLYTDPEILLLANKLLFFFFFFSLDVTIGLRIYSQSVPQIVGFAITKLHKNVMEISCRLLYRCQKDEGEKNKIPEEMHLSGGFFFKHFSFYEIDTDRLRVWTLDSEGGRW